MSEQKDKTPAGHDHGSTATMAIATNFGIPLTGSMATGFAIDFMKG